MAFENRNLDENDLKLLKAYQQEELSGDDIRAKIIAEMRAGDE